MDAIIIIGTAVVLSISVPLLRWLFTPRRCRANTGDDRCVLPHQHFMDHLYMDRDHKNNKNVYRFEVKLRREECMPHGSKD
jgi:hypothetical protein